MKLIRLVPVVAAVSLLAACSPAPSTVAVVNGERITSEDLQRTLDGCAEVGYGTDVVPRKAHVMYLTAGELMRQLAAGHGFELNSGEVRAVAAQNNPPELLANEDCAELVFAGSALSLMLENFTEDELVAELSQADVEVNPRYGRWDADQLGLTGDGSLSINTGR